MSCLDELESIATGDSERGFGTLAMCFFYILEFVHNLSGLEGKVAGFSGCKNGIEMNPEFRLWFIAAENHMQLPYVEFVKPKGLFYQSLVNWVSADILTSIRAFCSHRFRMGFIHHSFWGRVRISLSYCSPSTSYPLVSHPAHFTSRRLKHRHDFVVFSALFHINCISRAGLPLSQFLCVPLGQIWVMCVLLPGLFVPHALQLPRKAKGIAKRES